MPAKTEPYNPAKRARDAVRRAINANTQTVTGSPMTDLEKETSQNKRLHDQIQDMRLAAAHQDEELQLLQTKLDRATVTIETLSSLLSRHANRALEQDIIPF